MAQPADAQLIADSVLGTDLTQSECESLSEIVKHRTLDQGEVLFEPDTKDGNLYILIDGKLEILKVAGFHKEISINTLKKGVMIGELSFIDGDAHSMKLKARMPSEVLYLSRDDFEALVDTHPMVVFNVMRSILRYSHKLQRKMLHENLEMQRMVQNEYMA